MSAQIAQQLIALDTAVAEAAAATTDARERGVLLAIREMLKQPSRAAHLLERTSPGEIAPPMTKPQSHTR